MFFIDKGSRYPRVMNLRNSIRTFDADGNSSIVIKTARQNSKNQTMGQSKADKPKPNAKSTVNKIKRTPKSKPEPMVEPNAQSTLPTCSVKLYRMSDCE